MALHNIIPAKHIHTPYVVVTLSLPFNMLTLRYYVILLELREHRHE
jgi:hypothetical protein